MTTKETEENTPGSKPLDNIKHEAFAIEYSKPGTKHYLKAGRTYALVYGYANYDTDGSERNTCDANASLLVRNPKIHERIMHFMYAAGCNEETAVEAIRECMGQKEDRNSKLKATDLFYKYIMGKSEKIELSGEIKVININVKEYKEKDD